MSVHMISVQSEATELEIREILEKDVGGVIRVYDDAEDTMIGWWVYDTDEDSPVFVPRECAIAIMVNELRYMPTV